MPEPIIAVPPVPPPPDPLLTRASVTFHTNDDDKDNDTLVKVEVRLGDQRTVVAKLCDFLGHFPDHSDAGPFTLLMVHPARRSQSHNQIAIGGLAIISQNIARTAPNAGNPN